MKKSAKDKPEARAREKKWVPVPDPVRGGQKLYVQLPVEEEGGQPDPETLAEAAHFVRTLEANRQIAREDDEEPVPGATHAVETDAEGKKRLVRKRFTAI